VGQCFKDGEGDGDFLNMGRSKFSRKTNESNLRKVVRRASDRMLVAIANQIAEQAKGNLESNGQVDTRFLQNSIYVVTPEGSDYGATWSSGKYRSSKTGREVKRERGAEVELPAGAPAAVVAAAPYAIYPELENSYLYRAAEMLAGHRTEEIIKGIEGLTEV
jgi:hypothetical protein